MKTVLDRDGTIDGLQKILGEILQDSSINGLMILACDANNFTPQEIDPLLKNVPIPIFGGIFPSIIYEQQRLDQGTILMALSSAIQVYTIPDTDRSEIDFDQELNAVISHIYHANTIFTFVDGLSRHINSIIEALFNFFGLEVNYIGGGAGSLSFVRKPCLLTSDGLIQAEAVIALSGLQSGVAVNHGWKPVAGPFRVTASAQNTVKRLDHQPAFQIYKESIDKYSKVPIDQSNFFEIAKGFPLGISKMGNEHIVRDLIVLHDDNTMTAVGEVPAGSYVHILSGNAEKLISAAGTAAQTAQACFPVGYTLENLFFIDCISRVLFLEEQFNKELQAVKRKGMPMLGALTLGEIANNGKAYLEFYNKTSVVGILGE